MKATCVLHNYLTDVGDANYIPAGYADVNQVNGVIRPGNWRREGEAAGWMRQQLPGQNYTREAARIRNTFVDFFSSAAGHLEWQDAIINRR